MYDVLTAREYERNGEKKTTFNKIGVAFDNKNGDGFTITLNALPLPDKDGEVRMICKTSKPKETLPSNRVAAVTPADFDDEIPFAWLLPFAVMGMTAMGVA
jgi:hypothetical protein